MNPGPNPGTMEGRIAIAMGSSSGLAFATKCGFSDSLLRKYLKGSIPGADKLVAMARAGGVNVLWLATGEGPMRLDEGERERAAIPGVPTAIDEALMRQIAGEVARVYAEENARIQAVPLVSLATRLYADLVAAYDSEEERRVGLKLAIQQLRRDLRTPHADDENKRLA